MTVISNVSSWGPYVGNGVTNTFPYTNKIFLPTHLVVTQKNTTTLVKATLVLNVDYTVSGVGNLLGGNVVLFVPLPTGYSLTIERIVPTLQLTGIKNQGAFHAEIHEDAFDYLTMIDQQLRADLPPFEDPVALQHLRWKTDLVTIESVGVSSLGSMTATLNTGRITFASSGASIDTDSNLLWDNAAKKLELLGQSYLHSNNFIQMYPWGGPSDTAGRSPYRMHSMAGASHNGQNWYTVGISAEPLGSGTNGPVHMDSALGVSVTKQNYKTSTIDGQVTAINAIVRQGTLGDASGMDINIAGYGSGFFCIFEGLTYRYNSSDVLLDGVDLQAGVVDAGDIGIMGYSAHLVKSTGPSVGLRLNTDAGVQWDHFFQFFQNGVLMSGMDNAGGLSINALFVGNPSTFGPNRIVQVTQIQGAPAITIKRGTDTSPTSHYIECTNAAFNADRFVVTAAEPTSGLTNLLISYHNGTSIQFQTVVVGAVNTLGAGFRGLGVPN